MASLQGSASFSSLPENIIVEIFQYLPLKELCVVGRVCRTWRRVTSDNSLWRHVDLSPYKLNLQKMWKVIRAHFSEVLLSLRLRGHLDPAGINWKKYSVSEAMLKDLTERCPNVREFSIIEANLSNIHIKSFPPKIVKLTITKSLSPARWFRDIGPEGLLLNMTYLDLSNSSRIDNQDLKDICGRSSLQVLKLNGCYRVTETGLTAISESLSELQVLDIGHTKCTLLALHHIIRKLKKLLQLDVSNCKDVTDACVSGIVDGLKSLEWLSICGCVNVTDSSVTELLKAKSLKYADVRKTGISEAGITHLMLESQTIRIESDMKQN